MHYFQLIYYIVFHISCKYLQRYKYLQSITEVYIYFNDIYKLQIYTFYKYFLESHLKSRLYIFYILHKTCKYLQLITLYNLL